MILFRSTLRFVFVILSSLLVAPLVSASDLDDDNDNLTRNNCALADNLARERHPTSCGNQPVCGACNDTDLGSTVECESNREFCAYGMCGKVITGGRYSDKEWVSLRKFVFTSGATGSVTVVSIMPNEICIVEINDQDCTSCAFVQCQDGLSGIHANCTNLGAGVYDRCQQPDYGLTQGSTLIGIIIPGRIYCDSSDDHETGIVDLPKGDDLITEDTNTTQVGCEITDLEARKAHPTSCDNHPVCDACNETDVVSFVLCESSREYCVDGMCGKVYTGAGYSSIIGLHSTTYAFIESESNEYVLLYDYNGYCTVHINLTVCSYCAFVQCLDGETTGYQVDCTNLGAGILDQCQTDNSLTQGSILNGFVINISDPCSTSNATKSNIIKSNATKSNIIKSNATKSSATAFANVGQLFGFRLLSLSFALVALVVE